MPERDGYQPGIPCWVDTSQPDPEAAAAFYGDLFGWEFEDRVPASSPGTYLVAQLRGRDVAAVGSQPPGGTPPVPAWNTYVRVEDANHTAAKVIEAGGQVIARPVDVLDAGRMTVLADSAGAVFCAWQPGSHRGAQLVNEPGAWNWNELGTRDQEGAEGFYRRVFGWETATVDMGGDGYTVWRVPGYDPGDHAARDEVIGGITAMAGEGSPDDVAPRWGVAFLVDDVDAIAAKVADLGGEVVTSPFDAGILRFAVLADPQGAVFSVDALNPAG